MKKILWLLLAVVMAFSIIACGDGDDDDKDSTPGIQTPGSGNPETPWQPAEDWD